MFAADRYGSGVKFAELPLPFRQFPRVILSWTPLEACTRAKTDGVRERSRRRGVNLLYRFTAPSHGNDLGSNPSRSTGFVPTHLVTVLEERCSCFEVSLTEPRRRLSGSCAPRWELSVVALVSHGSRPPMSRRATRTAFSIPIPNPSSNAGSNRLSSAVLSSSGRS